MDITGGSLLSLPHSPTTYARPGIGLHAFAQWQKTGYAPCPQEMYDLVGESDINPKTVQIITPVNNCKLQLVL